MRGLDGRVVGVKSDGEEGGARRPLQATAVLTMTRHTRRAKPNQGQFMVPQLHGWHRFAVLYAVPFGMQ